MSSALPTGPDFEEQVRVVARAKWQLPAGGGSSETIAGHDIDIVCRTEEIVHMIMATTQRSLEKVSSDCGKLQAARVAEERRGNLAKAWVVTFFEPRRDQKSAAKDMGAQILSLDQFRLSLVDAGLYLNARANYRFGSATDPQTETTTLPEDEYIPLPLTDQNGASLTVADITQGLLSGQMYVLTGPFGAGKSLTVREIFREIRRLHFQRKTQVVPLAVNLREHWGQDDVSEVLTRHGRRIGYTHPDQLVRAWNAGQFIPLLEGFDELASRSWRVGPGAMAATRRAALSIIRDFVQSRAPGTGLLVAGRSQYFDTPAEMRNVLGLSLVSFVEVRVGEFSDEKALAYLKRKRGREVALPDWLPRKPLLLAYLSARDLLDEVLSIPDGLGVAYAWDEFLDRISAREAQITRDIDGSGVRQLLETLAARTRVGGNRGLLFESDLTTAYIRASGVEPSDEARVLLQRLPGLTARDDSEDGARTFVDPEMLDALRGSSSANFIRSPFEDPTEGAVWTEPLRGLGIGIASLLMERWNLGEGQAVVSARQAIERWGQPTLALDAICAGGVVAGSRGSFLDLEGLRVEGGFVEALDFEGMPIRNVALADCLIDELVLPDVDGDIGVEIRGCLVARVVGAAEARWLPSWIRDCDVASYDPADTNSAILAMEDLEIGIRVLLTVLRKLFIQRGAGRKESSFRRGLSQDAQGHVEPVLQLLETECIATVSTRGNVRIWQADRRQQGRVLAILAEKSRSHDPLLASARAI